MEPARAAEIRSVARQLLTTDGRASREFFWATQAGFFLVCAGLGAISKQLPESAKLFVGALALPLVLILWIVQVRRCHDQDMSGWWVLFNFVPCVGAVGMLVVCGFLPGTPGPNRFGPDSTAKPTPRS
jgi:uncharacterized membrane protein YhaH (DUF805 family)